MTQSRKTYRQKKVSELYDLIVLSRRENIDPAPSLADFATWTELPPLTVYYYIQKMIAAGWLQHLNAGRNRIDGSSSVYLPQRPERYDWTDFDKAIPQGRLRKIQPKHAGRASLALA